MKVAVIIALFGLAAATQRHEPKSFIQTKFVNFNEMKDDDVEEPKEPTAEDIKLQAEIAKKAKVIAVTTKEVETDEIKDAGVTNADKKKSAKKLAEGIAIMAGKLDVSGDSEDKIACDKQKAAAAEVKAAKDKKFADFAENVKDKTDGMDWVASMSDDIVSRKKFEAGPLKYANIQLN